MEKIGESRSTGKLVLVMNYIKTWKEVILTPSDFYRKMPMTGGYADPLIFAIICIIINTLLVILVRPTLLTIVGMHDLTSSISMFSNISTSPTRKQ